MSAIVLVFVCFSFQIQSHHVSPLRRDWVLIYYTVQCRRWE